MATPPTVPLIPPPQIVPGGQFADPFLDDFRNGLQDIINDIYENLTLLFIEGSEGLRETPTLTVGHSDYGSTASAPDAHLQLIGGATCIIVTADKQIVVGFWFLSDSGTNQYTVALVKSAFPYKIWSNLSGTSKNPTTITYAGSGTHNSGNPSLCQASTGSILVGYFDRDANAPKVAEYIPIAGGHWQYSATTTLATTYSFDNATLGELLPSEDEDGNEIILWGRIDNRSGVESAHIYKLAAGSWGTGPVGTWTRYYDPSSATCETLTGPPAGEDCRLIRMDGDYVLALWPWRGNSTDSRYTLLYALSADGGVTWPDGKCSGTDYAIGYPDDASGSIFPLVGGANPVPQGNMRGPSAGANTVTGRTWDAAYIPNSTKVGIAIWGDDTTTATHSRKAGVRYLEFDRTENDDTGGVIALAEWVPITYTAPIVGLMLSCSDGTPRLCWGQGVGTTINDGAISLMFSEVIPGANPLNALAWTTPKEVLRFTSEASSQSLQYFQFTSPVTGVFEDIQELVVWPILCARYNLNAVTLGAPSTQALLFLLPIEQLEEVEELEETESLISLDDLIAYWNLNEASGTTRFDSVGANHLADVNTVAQAGGKIDRSAQFDGAADYVSIPDNDDLSMTNLNGGFTVTAWVYPMNSAVNEGIINKGGAAADGQFGFILQHTVAFRATFVLSGNGTTTNSVQSTEALTEDDWNFVIFWYDANAETINIQVNNGTVFSAAHTAGAHNDTGAWSFGRNFNGAVPWFEGRVCDSSYWKRVLTADEREILWNDGDGLRYPFTG